MSATGDANDTDFPPPGEGYSLSGRLMLSAIVMLFTVVVLMVCLHIYARWFLLQERRRHLRRRSRTRTRAQLVFYTEPNNPNSGGLSRGLDAAVLSSIPVFLYSPGTHLELPECAVCLSEVEENEKIRILPKCNHGFHVECIDMWFHSHSTCPLCRSEVEPVLETRDFVVSVGEPGESETGSSSELFVTCPQEESGTSSSLGDRRKRLELERVTIEVPKRYEPANELRLSSPSSHGLKSPASSRLMSLKRILSLNRKGMAVSPSSAAAGVGTSRGVFDVECGRDESTQSQSRVQTPR